jgi:hypothetical protein
MATNYLPKDRRDLQPDMVSHAQANFFAICVKLRLFRMCSIGHVAMRDFARNLFRIVMRKYTNIWSKDVNGLYYRNQWEGNNVNGLE